MDGLLITLPRELLKCLNSHLGLRVKKGGEKSPDTKTPWRTAKPREIAFPLLFLTCVSDWERKPFLKSSAWGSRFLWNKSTLQCSPHTQIPWGFLNLKVFSRVLPGPNDWKKLEEQRGLQRADWEYWGTGKRAFGDGFILQCWKVCES